MQKARHALKRYESFFWDRQHLICNRYSHCTLQQTHSDHLATHSCQGHTRPSMHRASGCIGRCRRQRVYSGLGGQGPQGPSAFCLNRFCKGKVPQRSQPAQPETALSLPVLQRTANSSKEVCYRIVPLFLQKPRPRNTQYPGSLLQTLLFPSLLRWHVTLQSKLRGAVCSYAHSF